MGQGQEEVELHDQYEPVKTEQDDWALEAWRGSWHPDMRLLLEMRT